MKKESSKIMLIKQFIKDLIPHFLLDQYRFVRFDESQVIYSGKSYNFFLDEALHASRPYLLGKELRKLKNDIKRTYISDGFRPDEYLLYEFDNKKDEERSTYMPQKLKDTFLLDYYGENGMTLMGQLRNKYQFYEIAKDYFKRDVTKVETEDNWMAFEEFCHKHKRFICKIIDQGCGVGVKIEVVDKENPARVVFDRLLNNGSWIIEELINQDKSISQFNNTSVNTVRIPSFRHGDSVVNAYPAIRFGRLGSVVDNAGQGGVYASVNINTGEICSNGFDELGHEYDRHPDSKVRFKGFIIPKWEELINECRQTHLALPQGHTYLAFDYALSDKGWIVVEGNWGDFVMQQSSLKHGLKKEFLSLLYGD